jgi:hypothetical protein
VSRAAAVAYQPPLRLESPDDDWPGRGDSSIYRLLGDEVEMFGGPRPLAAPDTRLSQVIQADHFASEVEMPDAYFEAAGEVTPSKWRELGPRVVLSIAVAILLAVALLLVTPVLARGSGQTGSISLSRYADLASAASSSVVGAEIEVTTAPPAEGQEVAAVQPAPVQADRYSLIAPPSLSVAQIESVLARYGSPAVGQGQVLYELGVKYGIDPAYALAFFVHESGCGTKGVARFTHSLGNIRWSSGFENYEGYRMYGSWQEGMEDWYKLITDLYINGWGLKTVDAIVPVYAPAADSNNPPVYIASVKSMVDSWRGK